MRKRSTDLSDQSLIDTSYYRPSDEEYERAAKILAALAHEAGALDELPDILDMIGYSR